MTKEINGIIKKEDNVMTNKGIEKSFSTTCQDMTLQEILKFLRSNKEILRVNYGVSRIGLFGSYTKGKETENSDIDFYVEFCDKSFKNLSGLYLFLENEMRKKIDIVTGHKRMRKALKNSINKNIIYA